MLNISSGEGSQFKTSYWSTGTETIAHAAFSKDGQRFFAVSWNQLWIGSVEQTGTSEQKQWSLRAGSRHHLVISHVAECCFVIIFLANVGQSDKNFVSFEPYIVPFANREALFVHNPVEDKLQYLEGGSSTDVDLGHSQLGNELMRIALSEHEDYLIYIRKLERERPWYSSSQYFYGLAYRSIGRLPTGGLTLGAEIDTLDLKISAKRRANKKFSLITSSELGENIVWVVTTTGEVKRVKLR